MKFTTILLSLFSISIAFSQPSQWTSSDGRNAVMTLLSVSEDGDQLSGKFKMSNGTVVTLSEDKLAEVEKARLEEKLKGQKTKPQEDDTPAVEDAVDDVIFPALKDKVIVGGRKEMVAMTDFKAPEKYYLFYSTASWCGPCQSFTPDLVKFYKKYKRSHEELFEIVLLSSDKNEEGQVKYTDDKKMEWPQLSPKDSSSFKGKFRIPGGGIPNLTLTDTSGKIILSPKDGYASEVMDKFEDILKSEE